MAVKAVFPGQVYYVADTEAERDTGWPEGTHVFCVDSGIEYRLELGVFVVFHSAGKAVVRPGVEIQHSLGWGVVAERIEDGSVSGDDFKAMGGVGGGGGVPAQLAAKLAKASNLSDLTDASAARTNLGLGSIATQAANSVSITGGSVTGITDLAVADGGTGASTAVAAFDALSAQGTDVSSAGTINLDSATGDIVDVTGTTTITAITLSQGKRRIVRFTGALTLTHGASLVLPGGVNILTVAGDMAIFAGYAAGVVRCVSYSPLNADHLTTSGTDSNPTATTSTTKVMMGLNKVLTPRKTGNVLIIISGQAANDTGDDGFTFDLRYGTGTAPTNGAALTGTQVGGVVSGSCVASSTTTAVPVMPFCHHGYVAGLTINTAYWFDISLAAVTGGTATMTSVNVTIIEL